MHSISLISLSIVVVVMAISFTVNQCDPITSETVIQKLCDLTDCTTKIPKVRKCVSRLRLKPYTIDAVNSIMTIAGNVSTSATPDGCFKRVNKCPVMASLLSPPGKQKLYKIDRCLVNC
ncbi:uncharacterized protein LOC128952650 [Oppia nitens]|uniref:uncharacterized protein LOC128952650 n=1 Tax=Oppia nitens TaxID=1686743 RepID=UPI0023DB0946|nr:uncharacterized protein LOC128952650 [Oppia nitens]